MRLALGILFLFSLSFLSYSQSIESDAKFKKKCESADLLFKHKHYLYSAESYASILKDYPKALEIVSFAYNYAYSCYEVRDYSNAIRSFEMVIKESTDVFPLSSFYLGLSYLNIENGKTRAKQQLNTFINRNSTNSDLVEFVKLAKKQIIFLDELKSLNEELIPVFNPLINSLYNTSVSPFYLNDSLIYYTMSEPMVVKHSLMLDDRKVKLVEKKAFDMYQGVIVDGVVELSEVLEIEELPKKDNFETGSLSKDKSKLFFTKCRLNECEVYYSSKTDENIWSVPVVLTGGINKKGTGSKYPYVVEMSDGREVLFFSSDRNYSKSGWDIYYSIADSKGSFDKVHPLGTDINTILDETSPYYDVVSNTLYFSSNGHPSYGGKDVFSVQLNDFKATTPVLNVGLRVNSIYDDFHYRLNRDGVSGMLVSNRESTHEIDQILYFKYREAFDFKRVEHEYAERKFWVIEDNESSWIYVKQEGVKLAGVVEDGTEVVYLVNSNNEVVDVAEIKNNHFEFKDVPASEKLKVITNTSSNKEQNIDFTLTTHDETTHLDHDTIVRLAVQKQDLKSFKYQSLSRGGRVFKGIDETDDSYGLLVKAVSVDSLFIRTKYDVDHKFYLLNKLGEYMAYSNKESGSQVIKTIEAPSKLLFYRKVREDFLVFVTNRNNDTVSVFTLNSHPDLFAFLHDDYSGQDQINTSLNKDGLPTFKTYLSNYSVSGLVKPHTKVLLIDVSSLKTTMKTSNIKGEFKFENLNPENSFSIVVDEESTSIFDKIEFRNSKGDLVQVIDKKENPRFFSYKKLSPVDRSKYRVDELVDESSFSMLQLKAHSTQDLKDKSGVGIDEINGKVVFEAKQEGVDLVGVITPGKRVYLYNNKNELLTVVESNERGEFEFRKLPPNQSFHIEIEGDDESKFKSLSFIKGNQQIELSEDVKLFNYRKIEAETHTGSLYNYQDDSKFDFGKTNFDLIKNKEGQQVSEVKTAPKQEDIQVIEASTSVENLLVEIKKYCKIPRTNDEYVDFLKANSFLTQEEVEFKIQILSVLDPLTKPLYDESLLNKSLNAKLEQRGKALFLAENYLTLNDADKKRIQIGQIYGNRFRPIIVVYRNKKRVFSIIVND